MKLKASCTVTVPIKDISVNSIELAAIQGAREAAKKLFITLLEKVQKTLPKDRTCKCGGRFESRGQVSRELMSMVGDILFKRENIRCLHCGREKYLLDESIGISPRRLVTPGLRERALWLATEMAYDRASLGIHKLCGSDIKYGNKGKRFLLENGRIIGDRKDWLQYDPPNVLLLTDFRISLTL